MHWMLLPLKRYADFSGRSRRLEYWMYTLLSTIVLLLCVGLFVAGAVSQQSFGAGKGGDADIGPLGWLGIGLGGAWVLGTFIPGIAVTVRRFHDQDKSGWMYLLSFIPYVGSFVVFVFMFFEGTRGTNQYGPDPKNPDASGRDIFA